MSWEALVVLLDRAGGTATICKSDIEDCAWLAGAILFSEKHPVTGDITLRLVKPLDTPATICHEGAA